MFLWKMLFDYLILIQMELHGIERHTGFASAINHEVCKLITNSLITGWFTELHRDCDNKLECISCELIVLWHQLASSLVEYISLPNLAHPPDVSKNLIHQQ